jgi:predicted outer membrane protein
MSTIDFIFGAAAAAQPAAQQARAVSHATAQEFRGLLASSDKTDCAGETCSAQSAAAGGLPAQLDLDIEKALMSSMPSTSASPAEFAVGLLRAQVKVSQTAVAIELVSKTTQSLSQGVQSLTMRS